MLDHNRAGYWRYWAVTRQGVYFVTAKTPSRPVVEFFSFATGEIGQVATLEKPIADGVWGFSIFSRRALDAVRATGPARQRYLPDGGVPLRCGGL